MVPQYERKDQPSSLMMASDFNFDHNNTDVYSKLDNAP